MPSPAVIKLAIVDDHALFRKGLISLLENVTQNFKLHFKVVFEAANGSALIEKLPLHAEPEIILMDINMPVMDGFACVSWLKEHNPQVKVLVVSMIEKEESILRMIRLGVKGYLSKDVEPKDLAYAISSIIERGFYYTDFITGKLLHSLQNEHENVNGLTLPKLNDREKEFLQLACSELTYNQIAAKMFLSPKTIDGYRIALFEKLGVKTRVGLALYAVKHNLVVL